MADVENSKQSSLITSSRNQYSYKMALYIQWLSFNCPTVLNPVWVQKLFQSMPDGRQWTGVVSELDDSFKQNIRQLLLHWVKETPPFLFDHEEFTPELFLQWVHTFQGKGFDLVAGSRSAFKAVWTDHEILGWEVWKGTVWEKTFAGLQKRKAQAQQEGDMSHQKGKKAMPFNIFSDMTRGVWDGTAAGLRGKGKKKISLPFTLVYMLLCWNLMSRSKNISDICFSHLGWNNDALTVHFCVMKTNQKGRNMHDRHVYANPIMPWMCPILALGVYLLVTDFEAQSHRLFPGNKPYSRFTASMKGVNQRFAEQFDCIKRYGTHSFRKGAATYTQSGNTAGPSNSAVSIRCGWKQNGVQDTYLVYEGAGDQYVGRTVCGLPINSHEFAVLPPFFPTITEKVMQAVNMCFPSLLQLDNQVKQFCLASVVHHRQWLLDTLPVQHELRQTALFLEPGLLDELALLVVCRLPLPQDAMFATGVPPHVVHLRALKDQQEERGRILNAIHELTNSLTPTLDSVADRIVIDVLKGLDDRQVESTVTPTSLKRQVEEILGPMQQGLNMLLQSISGQLGELREHGVDPHPPNVPQAPAVGPQPNYPAFTWGGKIGRLLPEGFRFPKGGKVREMWLLYMVGNKRENVRPLRGLDRDHFAHKNTRKRASEFFQLMEVIETKIKSAGGWVADDDCTVEQAIQMYEQHGKLDFPDKTAKKYTRRPTQLAWRTAFTLIQQKTDPELGNRAGRLREESEGSDSDEESSSESPPVPLRKQMRKRSRINE